MHKTTVFVLWTRDKYKTLMAKAKERFGKDTTVFDGKTPWDPCIFYLRFNTRGGNKVIGYYWYRNTYPEHILGNISKDTKDYEEWASWVQEDLNSLN
jgi:hypothetical protein